MRKLLVLPVAAAAVIAAAGCSAGPSSSAVPAATHSAKPKTDSSAACSKKKPAYGDLLVRDAIPGTPALTSDIGGQWSWDSTTGKCLDAVAYTIATAGQADGECTTIALAKSNPGYDTSASPAPKLKKVIAKAGPGCG